MWSVLEYVVVSLYAWAYAAATISVGVYVWKVVGGKYEGGQLWVWVGRLCVLEFVGVGQCVWKYADKKMCAGRCWWEDGWVDVGRMM